MTETRLTPIFQDVDGVLNIFPEDYVAEHLKQSLHQFKASPNRFPGMTEVDKQEAMYRWGGLRRYRITTHPDITDKLAQMHRDGKCEIIWCTTWGSGANGELRAGLKWPRLQSAGSPQMKMGGIMHTEDNNRWWKWNRVEAWLEKYGHTGKFVWIDDHFIHEEDAWKWAEERGGMVICTDEVVGLTGEDLDNIEEYLNE